MSLILRIENDSTREHLPDSALSTSIAGNETILVYRGLYREGDSIVLTAKNSGTHVMIQLDDSLPASLVYLSGNVFRFSVPFAESRACYCPRAFTGSPHLICARLATEKEIHSCRNLALNPYDTCNNAVLFPHASANVVTRGESVFAARNAIDGLKASSGHGEWPYTSWGINRDPDALFRLDFGRLVRIFSVVFYLRADFPHDAWWESATLKFSDGSSVLVSLQKILGAQSLAFPERCVEWVTVGTFVKANDPSPFPALTQFEIYGTEIAESNE